MILMNVSLPPGELTEIKLIINELTERSTGYAYVTFKHPEHAVKAYTELDHLIFLDRCMFIQPSDPPREPAKPPTEPAKPPTEQHDSQKSKRRGMWVGNIAVSSYHWHFYSFWILLTWCLVSNLSSSLLSLLYVHSELLLFWTFYR